MGAISGTYRVFGKRLIERGSPLLAHEAVSEGLRFWPRDPRLRQLSALALARGGAAAGANRILRQLYDEGHRDEETLGILGRTHKDMALGGRPAAERTAQLRALSPPMRRGSG